MGQHKVPKPQGHKAPNFKFKARTVNWPTELYERMEQARIKTAVPVLNAEGKQIATRTPEMSECYILWMGAMMDVFEQATKQQERQQALVLTPAELTARGAKLPLDLMRRS